MEQPQIALLGDIAFNGTLSSRPEKNASRYKNIIGLLKEIDLVFANLEVPVKAEETINEEKNFRHFSILQPTEELLKMLHISCVSLANNHIYDYKMSGLKATINLLDEIEIFHTGAGWKKEHIDPVIIEKFNQKIGFCAYVHPQTNPKTETFNELLINYYNKQEIIKTIKTLSPKVDKIIVSLHWGKDYSNFFQQWQQNDAKDFIDAGADIIMGHHPHTMQPFEKYKEGYIFYSLGGLTFGDFETNGKLIALNRKTKKAFHPVFCSNRWNELNFIKTKELKGNNIRIINWNVTKWSEKHFKLSVLSFKYYPIHIGLKIKEALFDRFFEFFFGYYRDPLKEIFKIKNLKKIRYIKRDLIK